MKRNLIDSPISMRNNVVLISTGMYGQSEAFEEPGINSITSYLRKHEYDTKIELVLHEKLDIEKIKKFNPALIGFSVYTDTYNSVKKLCKFLKKNLKESFIVLGGYVATYYSKEVLIDIEDADAVIVGEGEIPMLELANCISTNGSLDNVSNLVYRSDGSIIFTKRTELISELDSLPFAARDIVTQYDPTEVWVSTSRGCTRNCAFCCSHDFWHTQQGHNWRGRSVKNIIEEISYLIDKHGVRQFEFIDNSLEDPYPYGDRLFAIAEAIIGNDLKIAFGANMRAETFAKMKDEDIEFIKHAGFSYVFLGIEGFCDNSLRLYRKTANVLQNKMALKALSRHGIPVDIGFINFNPYSTFNDLEQNIKNLNEFGLAYLQYVLTFLYVFRGTPLYNKIKNDGLLYKDDGVEDCLCYRYVDTKVGIVAEYLMQVKGKIESSGVMENSYFVVHFRKKCAQLMTILKKYDFYDSEMEQVFNDINATIAYDINHINEAVSDWFLGIIELGKTDFNISQADELTTLMLNEMKNDHLAKLKAYKKILYGNAYKRFLRRNIQIK